MTACILVAEGNTADVRARMVAAGKPTTADAYVAVLRGLIPDATYAITCPADDGWSPPDLSRYQGAVFTGSALHAYDELPHVRQQVALARGIFAAGIPFFGSCWGMQIAAIAAGGQVRRNPKGREIGFARQITLTESGRSHPMFRGKAAVFDAPAIHLDEVAVLPPHATLLAGNAMSTAQAVEIRHDRGVFWGVQYHPEYPPEEVAATLRRYEKVLAAEGAFADDAARALYVDDFKTLASPETRAVYVKRHGLDAGALDPSSRMIELSNWLSTQVRDK